VAGVPGSACGVEFHDTDFVAESVGVWAAVTLTTTVTGLVTPTGTVTITYGSTTLGSGSLSAGSFTFSTSSLPAGNDVVDASYLHSAEGLANYRRFCIPYILQPSHFYARPGLRGKSIDALMGSPYHGIT
jgi:hypothetical protein